MPEFRARPEEVVDFRFVASTRSKFDVFITYYVRISFLVVPLIFCTAQNYDARTSGISRSDARNSGTQQVDKFRFSIDIKSSYLVHTDTCTPLRTLGLLSCSILLELPTIRGGAQIRTQ